MYCNSVVREAKPAGPRVCALPGRSALGRGALLAAALVVCGSPATALPVRVGLEWPADRPPSAVARIHVQAIRTAGPPASGPVEAEAEAGPAGAILDLGGGVWQVQASAPGYWSDGAEVTVEGRTPTSLRLALWPAASLHGEILMDGGRTLPRELEVRLSAVAAEPAPSPSRATLRCRIEGGAWSCVGPAGVFDVQLEAAGYAPRYVWDVSLDAAGTDLGRTVLRLFTSVDFAVTQIIVLSLLAVVGMTIRQLPTFAFRSAGDYETAMADIHARYDPDLAQFWKGAWADARRDMRGRYPKHDWPEDGGSP